MGTPFSFFLTSEDALRAALAAGALEGLTTATIDDLDPVSLGRALAALTGEDLDVWLARIGAEPSDDAAPRERALFWELPADTVARLAREGSGELAALAESACAAGQALYYCLVDPGLFDLVLDLHRAGHPTEAGCQGRSCPDEFAAKRHGPGAYVTFAEALPEAIRRALAAEGLVVYADGRGVACVSFHVGDDARPGSIRGYRRETETRAVEDFRDDAIRAVIAANATFVERMRRAFGL